MATRLLDWTQNALAALYFAVREGSKNREDGVLWILPFSSESIAKQDKESPFDGVATNIFQPKHITKSIVAQSGWFTVHKYIDEKERFIPLEDNKLYRGDCKKCQIPSDCFLGLKHQLDRVGVNEATMFPELRGLCDYLNFVHLPDLLVTRFPRVGDDGTSTTESQRS